MEVAEKTLRDGSLDQFGAGLLSTGILPARNWVIPLALVAAVSISAAIYGVMVWGLTSLAETGWMTPVVTHL